MSGAIAALIILTVLAALVSLLAWFLHQQEKPTVQYTSDIPTWNYSFRVYQQFVDFNRETPSFDGQNERWQSQMRVCGSAMVNARVRKVIFVHGTFVGDDPTGLISILKIVYPNIEKTLASKIKRITRKQTDFFIKDLGNYSHSYVKLFEQAIGGTIPCSLFSWSSGNHHYARLEAAVQLAHEIAGHIRTGNVQAEDRILLVGHSHGAQVFAMLAQLIEYELFGYKLLDILNDAGNDNVALNADLNLIRQISLDFATFGAPVVYTWPDSGYYRLLNIINHRGTSHLAGSLKGLLHTKDGDYIQQLGILGTDLIAATAKERRLNKRLDELYGKGRDIKSWKQYIGKKMRVSPHGKTFLVNYKDHSRTLPNFVKTMFGHGVYTRLEAMLFNTRLLSEYFYKNNPR